MLSLNYKNKCKIKRTVALVGTALMLSGAVFTSNTEGVFAKDWDAEINQTQGEIDKKLKEVNSVESELEKVIADIEDQDGKIKTKENEIDEKEEEVEKRIEHTKEQLKAMQKSEINRNIVITLLNSKSITEFFNTVYKVSVINDANEKNLNKVKEESEQLDNLKEELVEVREELGKSKDKKEDKKEVLEKDVKELENVLAESKQKKEEEIQRAKEAEQRLLAEAKKKEEEAKRVKLETSGKKSEGGSNKSSSKKSVNKNKEVKQESSSSGQKGGWMTFNSTGYSTQQPGLSTHTATGIDLRSNPRVIAVDPSQIPLGSNVEVEGMGVYVAGDTGGAIKGKIIDVHFSTVQQALNWGRRNVRIRIIN